MRDATDILAADKQHQQRGYDYIKRSQWAKAREEFQKCVELNPKGVWPHIELGKLYRNETNFPAAEKIFKQVLNMHLNNEQAEQAHLCLGDIYRMLGKYDSAMAEFKQALQANPNNKKLALWLEDSQQLPDAHKRVAPYRIFFTWRIDYQCNYRCSYCLTPKPEKSDFNQEKRNVNLQLGPEQWTKIWENIYNKYGACRIRLDGGEPSVYPGFIELVAGVSQMHLLQINTNLSFNVEKFVKKVSPARGRIDASLHPEFVSLEEFVRKISILIKHKFKIVVSCVAYPPFLDKMNEYKRPFQNLHIPFIIHPLSGEYKGKNYPRDYEIEELSKIYSLDEASRLVMNWRKGEGKTTKGKLCRMGQMYATIFPNGEAYRCCVNENRLNLGNISDQSFQLLDKPLTCTSENCLCWKSMIVNEEERWTSLWMDDWEMPPPADQSTVAADSAQRHLGQGNLYRSEGKYDLALKEFELALEENSANGSGWLEIGKTYKMMDRCPEAIEKFIQAVRINPNNKEAIIELGETSRLSNNCTQAIAELERLIGSNDINEYAYIELGKTYQKLGSYDAALEQLNKAYAIDPLNGAAVLGLGQVYKDKGAEQQASEKFQEALKIDSNNKDAHVELGKIYQEQKNYPAASEEFKKAIKISPLDTKIRLNLIEVYVQQGKTELSEQQAQETLEVSPRDSFSQDWMLNEIEILQKKTVIKSRIKRLWVTVTTRCNIKCRTCGLWSNPWDLPRKTAEEVMQLYPYMERIVWLGGEVFLYKFFDEMFQKALAFPRLEQQIITNGVILTKDWIERIVRSGVELTFSVDGVTKDVYEYIRRGASFDKLIENLKITNELRKIHHSRTKIRLNALIMKSNYLQIEEFIDFAKRYNFDQLSLLAVHFDEDPKENILYSKKDDVALAHITAAIPKIRQKAGEYNIDLDILLPTQDLKFDDFESRQAASCSDTQPKVQKEQMHCKMPWKYLFICDDGKVYLTGSCVKTIGNIYENSIAEIWNSEGAQFYRESMLKNRFQGLCRPECMTRWEV